MAKGKQATPAEPEATNEEGTTRVGPLHEAHAAYLKRTMNIDVSPTDVFAIYSTRVAFRGNKTHQPSAEYTAFKSGGADRKAASEAAKEEAKAKREADRKAASETKAAAKAEKEAERKAASEKKAAEKAEADAKAAATKKGKQTSAEAVAEADKAQTAKGKKGKPAF